MARTAGTFCMFCDSDPCICNRTASPKPKKTQPKPAQPTQPAPALDAMREAAQKARHRKRIETILAPVLQSPVSLSDEDAAFLQAVRLLNQSFDLGGPDVEQFKPYLAQGATVAEGSAAWRYRRSLGEHNLP